MGANDNRIIEAYPQLTATDLANTWAYAKAFPDKSVSVRRIIFSIEDRLGLNITKVRSNYFSSIVLLAENCHELKF
jgi:uncharacterized protein (DUF2126 family)